MDFQIITEAPGWMTLLCIAAGLAAAFLLYRKDAALAESSKKLVLLMAAMRFLTVALVSFLLLSPLIRTIFTEVERPLLLVIQDGSESVAGQKDSTVLRNNYRNGLEQLVEELSSAYEVRSFTVGDHVREGIDYRFEDKQTDLSAVVPELKARFAGRNTGAVILATDGLYNTGSNPLYAYDELQVPVYTVAMGDTTVRKDLLIANLRYNKTTYKGNTFPVEITVDARQAMGQPVELSVFKGTEKVYSAALAIRSQRFNTLVPVFLEATEKGLIYYRVTLNRLGGEISYLNNEAGFYIEVTDNRQKVLLLANSPHPDLAFISNVLEQSKSYDIVTRIFQEFDGAVSGYNLVILHQLPGPSSMATQIAASCKNLGIPIWYILGAQTNVTAFNALETGLRISDNRGNTGEVQADPVIDFATFTVPEAQLNLIAQLPPLINPFGNYQAGPDLNILLKQRVGQVKTGMPLLSYSSTGNLKNAVLAGEGIWKWALAEYAIAGNRDATSGLVLKTVQFLSSGRKPTPFRVFIKNDHAENEQVLADAELYNESGEPVNSPEVTINFLHDDGRKFDYMFSRHNKNYSLNAGFLPPGKYTYTASTQLGKKAFTESGAFTVSELFTEQSETIADHQLLNALSVKTGGKFFMPEQLQELADSLNNRSDIRPVSYTRKKLDDLVHLKWYFFLLVVLLTAEWFLRKRSGTY